MPTQSSSPTPTPNPTPVPTPDPAPAPEAEAGTTAYTTTDPESDGATTADPIETGVQWPAGVSEGTTTIAETSSYTEGAPAGYEIFGQQVDITAPDGTIADPISIAFTLDASIIPAGADANSIEVLRNGTAVPDCDPASSGVADPDPCVHTRFTTFDGDIVLGIYTSAASAWNFAAAEQTPQYDFDGFFAPVDNPLTMNVTGAGRGIPIKFSLNGYQGMDIIAEGYPASYIIDCNVPGEPDLLEPTSTAGQGGLSYDAASDTYTYVWKTEKIWKDTCRQFVLRLDDGSEHYANFKFTK